MNIDSKIVAFIYEHTELCSTCAKEGQRIQERVTIGDVTRPYFDRANIPVGWYSTYEGVYCSEECMKAHKYQ